MTQFKIAQAYATSLFRFGQMQDADMKPDGLISQFSRVALFLLDRLNAPEARSFLKNSLRKTREELQAFQKALEESLRQGFSSVPPSFFSFLNLITQNKRLFCLEPMLKFFLAYVDQCVGIIQVHVSYAAPLDDMSKNRLEKSLETYFQKKMRIHYECDKTLLDGFIIKVSDLNNNLKIDASLKSKFLSLSKLF